MSITPEEVDLQEPGVEYDSLVLTALAVKRILEAVEYGEELEESVQFTSSNKENDQTS